MLKFYKIEDCKCDICGKHKKVVTEVQNENQTIDLYICNDCASLIKEHAMANLRALRLKNLDKIHKENEKDWLDQ